MIVGAPMQGSEYAGYILLRNLINDLLYREYIYIE